MARKSPAKPKPTEASLQRQLKAAQNAGDEDKVGKIYRELQKIKPAKGSKPYWKAKDATKT